MTDPITPTPVEGTVTASAKSEVASTVLRDVAIVAAAFPILVKLAGARDLNGLLHWLQSSDGATVLAIVVPIALTAWRGRRSWLRKWRFIRVSFNAPDEVIAVVPPKPIV